MRMHEILVENAETQHAIERVANDLLLAAAHKAARIITDKFQQGWRDLDADDMGGVGVDDAYPSKQKLSRFPAIIRAFIEGLRGRFRLAFTASDTMSDGRSARGWYRGGRYPEIILSVPDHQFDPITKTLQGGWPIHGVIRDVLTKKQNVMVHELTHTYDDWISSGKHHRNARSQKAAGAELRRKLNPKDAELVKQAHQLYLNDPVEINARYVAAVAKAREDERSSRTGMGWKEFRQSFIWNFNGWRELPVSNQHRLLVRLASEWQHGRTTWSPDIKQAVSRLRDRLESIGSDVGVSTSETAHGSILRVYLRKPHIARGESAAMIAAVLRPITMLADIYGLTVTIEDKIPPAIVRPFGFINQRFRSGGKRDYALPLGVVYFRRPQERRKMAA